MAIRDEIQDDPFELPADRPLTVVLEMGGPVKPAYVEPIAVGDPPLETPIVLATHSYVPAPLEASDEAWAAMPAPIRELVEGAAR